MAKQLKIWNGRGYGQKYNRHHVYVAAYSVKQAAELIGQALGLYRSIGSHEINNYYSKGCWGNNMDGITATEPCVYVSQRVGSDEKPIRLL